MMSLSIEVIRDTDRFAALQPEWDRLLKSSPQDCPFLAHMRLFAWWELFGGDKRLYVVTCRDESGELVGVLPAYLKTVGRRVTARSLHLLADRDVGSTNLGPFALPQRQADVIDALKAHLRERPRAWDVLDFAYVEAHDPFFLAVKDSPAVRIVPKCGSTQRILLPRDWESYRASLSKSKRLALNAAINKSNRLGDRIEMIAEADQLPSALEDLWRLHEMRMTKKMGPEFDVNPRYRLFVERVARQMLAEGRLRLAFLRRDDERVAVVYQFVYGNAMYGEKSGFDPSDKSADLLRPLIGGQIREAIENGYAIYDLMLGDEPYKQGWGVNEVQHFSHVRVYDRSLYGRLRQGRDALAARLDEARSQRSEAASVALR